MAWHNSPLSPIPDSTYRDNRLRHSRRASTRHRRWRAEPHELRFYGTHASKVPLLFSAGSLVVVIEVKQHVTNIPIMPIVGVEHMLGFADKFSFIGKPPDDSDR
jgi:hypothetical protein